MHPARDTDRSLVLEMGNESSQLEKNAHTADQGDRPTSPAMSPAQSHGSDHGRVFGPSMSPLPGDDGNDSQGSVPREGSKVSDKKKKKKKRKKKHRRSLDDDPEQVEEGPVDEAAGLDEKEAGEPTSSKKKKSKKKLRDSDAAEAHRAAESSQHDQEPPFDDILRYDSGVGGSLREQANLPSRQLSWTQRPLTESRESTAELIQPRDETFGDDSDEEVRSPIGHNAVVRHQTAVPSPLPELESGLAWLHKDDVEVSNTPGMENRKDRNSPSGEDSPGFLLPQIKTEPMTDSGVESDSASPSAARFERLSGSRSRSASKASVSGATRLTEKNLELSRSAHSPSRATSTGSEQRPTGGIIDDIEPSSTGSNASIPARVEPANSNGQSHGLSRPTSSRSSTASLSQDTNGDDMPALPVAMDVDSTSESNRSNSPVRLAADMPSSAKETVQPMNDINMAVPDENAVIYDSQGEKEEPLRRRSNGGIYSRDVHVMANWLAQSEDGVQSAETEAEQTAAPEDDLTSENVQVASDNISSREASRKPKSARKRKAKASLVPDIVIQDAVAAPLSSADIVAEENASESGDRSRDMMSYERDASVARHDSVELGESANQSHIEHKGPSKSKKKRKLQRNTKLSLSQIEDDEEAVDGPSRLSALPQSVAQEPISTSKPRKTKRKRRDANEASDDELENLLAAGPSSNRRSKGALDFDDDEEKRAAKRKRLLSSGEKSTGPWTSEELRSLGQVVAEFRDANGMTQYQMNELVHEQPKKVDRLKTEFWTRADLAIPGRTLKQIRERARRLYHNFVGRNVWNEEQKQELHELFEQYGDKPTYPWALIAATINRDQKDVRDYWRNHYLVHENHVKARWTKEEEENLREVVDEALNKIRIMRENNHQARRREKADSNDVATLVDWQQISKAMGLTRSRQQCKWKWYDMREKGLLANTSFDLSTHVPSSPATDGHRSGTAVNGISSELASARDDFDKMSDEDLYRLVDSIHDRGARSDGHIRWGRITDRQFRDKWKRPTLKLAWYRLRREVPGFEQQSVEENAQYLLNYYNQHRSLPRLEDNQVDEQTEEYVIRFVPGKKKWAPVSDTAGARVARQGRSRLSRSASSRSKIRKRREVSNEVSDEMPSAGRSDDDGGDVSDSTQSSGGQQQERELSESMEDVSITIPKHLKGKAAKAAALEEAHATRSGRGSGKRKAMGKSKGKGSARGARSASVAIDSDSE